MDAMFLLLGRSFIDEGVEMPLYRGRDFPWAYETLKTVIVGLLREITDEKEPFRTSFDKKRSCPYCDFQYLCGTQWIAGRIAGRT